MLRLIEDRLASGVDVRIIGKVETKWDKIPWERYPGKRLHVRAIIRDGRRAFVGSQSLRRIELDKRRELGVIVTDQAVVNEMREVFQSDWAKTDSGKKEAKKAEKASKKEEKVLAAAS
jgi:cardiolipin synthase